MTKITMPTLGLDSKKAYQKPTMNVVLLQHQNNLLAGSPQTLEGNPGEWQELE